MIRYDSKSISLIEGVAACRFMLPSDAVISLRIRVQCMTRGIDADYVMVASEL